VLACSLAEYGKAACHPMVSCGSQMKTAVLQRLKAVLLYLIHYALRRRTWIKAAFMRHDSGSGRAGGGNTTTAQLHNNNMPE
jgi:hypothetical protein